MEPREKLEIASKSESDRGRAHILIELAPLLNDELKAQALVVARDIKDEYWRTVTLTTLAPYLNDDLKLQMIRESLAAAREVKYRPGRIYALINLVPFLLDEGIKLQVIQEAFVATLEVEDKSLRARFLIDLAPYLNDDLKKQVYDASLHIEIAYLLIGESMMLLESGNYNEALARLDKTRVFADSNPQLRNAIKEQEEMIKLNQKLSNLAHRSLNESMMFFAQGQYDKALASLDKTRVLANSNPQLRNAIKEQEEIIKLKLNRMLEVERFDKVAFTAYYPNEENVEFWHTLLVYTHVLSALNKVQEDAKRFSDQISPSKETTSESSTPIAQGTELTIVPSCEGVTFNPEQVSLKWMEDFHRADFRFKADKSLSGDAAKGSIDIYVGPLIIGTLKFAMLFNDEEAQPVPDHEEHATMYGKDDVFISYSRKDTEVARTFKTVLEGSGFDVFLDVDDIRSGQFWGDELKRRIKRAKIFQIFWSSNYSQSENCKQEWEYALKQNKDEGYIRPVFWQKPLTPNPPEELNKFNFKYVELKV